MKFDEEVTACSSFPMANSSQNELMRQLDFYKEEIDKKDELIRRLTKSTMPECVPNVSGNAGSFACSTDKLNEIKASLDKLRQNAAEQKNIIEEKNTTICELRAENESLRVNNIESMKRIEELEFEVQEKANQLKCFERAEEQNDLVLQSLQMDIKTKNTKLLDMKTQSKLVESQLREKLSAQEKSTNELNNIMREMSKLLECDSTPENCLFKLIDLIRTTSNQRTLLAQKSDEKEEFEFEQRAFRETIMRLSGELNKAKQDREAADESANATQEELQKTRALAEELQQRSRLLDDRVQQLTQSLQSARQDADEKDKKLALLTDAQSKLAEQLSKHNAGAKLSSASRFSSQFGPDELSALDSFLDDLVNCLSIPEEEDVIGILALVQNRFHELMEKTEQYKKCLRNTEKQLQQFTETHCSPESVSHFKARIDQLEHRLATEGMTTDHLRQENRMLADRIHQIAMAAKLDGTILTLDLSAVCDALTMRIEQLQQCDTENQAKQRLHITRLQRQLKDSKEKIDTLELQVSVLRNRLTEAQDRRLHVVTPASQTPMSLAASERERRRLAKQLEQTKSETEELRKELVVFKARLLDSSKEKLSVVGQAKTLQSARVRFDELNRTCDVQNAEMQRMRKELDQTSSRYQEELLKLQEATIRLEKELRDTKEALETSHRSEKQLLEFRSLVARQLGMRCEELSIPDYQIMMRLNRLIGDKQAKLESGSPFRRTIGCAGEE